MKKKFLVALIVVLWGLLFYLLLSQADSNSAYLIAYYDELFYLTLTIGFLLIAWVFILFLQLLRQRRRKVFGVRLTTRFALAFIAVGVLPTILVYILSVQFISRTIESWFNVRVESALDAKLKLSQAEFSLQLSHLKSTANQIATQINLAELEKSSLSLSTLREQSNLHELLIFTESKRVIAFSTQAEESFIPQLPPDYVFQQIRLSQHYAQIETQSLEDTQLLESSIVAPRVEKIRVVVPLKSHAIDFMARSGFPINDPHYLQVIQKIPLDVAEQSQRVLEGYSDYNQLQHSRESLKNLYSLMLTLGLLFSILGSMFAAFYLSKRLASPLLKLAQGTEAVAAGKFNLIPLLTIKDEQDEILQLTTGFNVMLLHLQEARRLVEVNQIQLKKTNAYLENILQNLSAGVLVLDDNFHCILANQGASVLLKTAQSDLEKNWENSHEQLMIFYERVKNNFRRFEESKTKKYWQEQIELLNEEHLAMNTVMVSDDHKETTLLVRGVKMKVDTENYYIVVFDDVTELISANRTKAWGEVARRLAHEIKNPLTPIQLSAERLSMKLTDKLDEAGKKLLDKGTQTIITQVSSLIKMVNEFREYARTPNVILEKLDLNNIIEEVLLLYGWDPVEKVLYKEENRIPIEVRLVENVQMIDGDAGGLRQIVHNLLKNAFDALEDKYKVDDEGLSLSIFLQKQKLIVETAHVFDFATSGERSTKEIGVRFTIEDSGVGFSSAVLSRPYEPYVTTKEQGTGLGLAIVKKIVEEHGAQIEITNTIVGGAKITILFARSD